MTAATLGLLLLAPASPIPVPPRQTPAPGIDRNEAFAFASAVFQFAERVKAEYVREVTTKEMIEGAIRGLYDEAGEVVPDEVLRAIRNAVGATDLMNRLVDARLALGKSPTLSGPRAMFAATNGFRYALDSHCGLTSSRVNTYASVDMDFQIGLELDGATGQRWAVYQLEYGMASGRIGTVGGLGRVPNREAVMPPVTVPWRVKRVIPGGPGQKAGVRPGDVITHLNDTEVTPASAAPLFAKFAYPPFQPNPTGDGPAGVKRKLTFRRPGNPQPFTVTITSASYAPESVHGVMRQRDGKWDGMLDREYKIGYVRVGPIEEPTDAAVEELVGDLVQRGCRGLILDLRWCPGGYVDPGVRLAGLFLPQDAIVARTESRVAIAGRDTERVMKTPGQGRFRDLPLVVLVGSDTTGGGELIASALQDNQRCVVIGQRTAGRAAIQHAINTQFGLPYKVTTGTSFRPNGKPRARTPQSQPTDDWGIRPDPGLEVAITRDLAAELKRWAELHALRPADGTESLDFDDPAKDPFRVAALAYFRKKLGRP